MSAGKEYAFSDRNTIDSAIKLFGRTIPFSTSQDPCSDLTRPQQAKSSASRPDFENRPLVAAKKPETNPRHNEEQAETSNDDAKEDEKNFKKLDKLVPCPRCNSYETKFCYFNNYNVNQPRHFCKNCHRYWTAGGTMRNVPVGAGRRRNKHIASQFQVEASDSANHPLEPSSSNVTLLNFGPKKRFCNAMDSAFEEVSTSGSSVTTGSNMVNEFSEMEGGTSSRPRTEHSYLVHPSWDRNLIPGIGWQPGAGVEMGELYTGEGNGNGSGILGKHCRDLKVVEDGKVERSVLVPKTLRVDDPAEASKSSIWDSLGFKPYSLETKF